jgi:acetyltransferase
MSVAPMPQKPQKSELGSSELHQTVRGGEHVLTRRARSEDVALYRDFLADVSAEDLRLRFFADIAELSAAEGEKLAHLDRHNIVFVGIDEETGQMLGLVRLKEELDEETAEFAIMVRSRLKGHGLGWMLMQRAIDYGKEKGLRRIYGDVLPKTRACCKCAKNLASAPTTWDRA